MSLRTSEGILGISGGKKIEAKERERETFYQNRERIKKPWHVVYIYTLSAHCSSGPGGISRSSRSEHMYSWNVARTQARHIPYKQLFHLFLATNNNQRPVTFRE